jgi:PBSX family phage portal protein
MADNKRLRLAVPAPERAGEATMAGNEANQGALRGIRARVVGIVDTTKRFDDGAEPGQSKTLPEDPFRGLAAEGEVIEPPFDTLTLAMLPEHSSELGQCIEAMQINIEGFGHRQKSRVKLDDPAADQVVPETLRNEVLKERTFLANFFEYSTEESFVEFRKRLRKDLESTGNAYFEVIRDVKAQIQSFKHIPSYQMRLSKIDDEPIEIDRPILELQPDGSVKVKKVKEWRRFRRYVQSRAIHRRNLSLVGTKKRWFKAFLDPRTLDNDLGKFEGAKDGPKKVKPEREANEIVHLKQYSARTPYGVPRFAGNLLAIFGDRASEEINYITFRNNNIPSMVVLCSNGQLTEGTIERIESFVEAQIQGSDNYSKFLIIEGESSADEGEEAGQLKLDIKPLTKDQHDDALFQDYSSNNQDKIRRAFRLPPIFVGRSDDYTRATAESSRRLADEQVFAPERDEFDNLMNRIIYPAMGVKYHKFKSNSPNTTDNEQLVKILGGAEKTGGMTPRIARLVLGDILSQDIGDDFPADFPADAPFSLTMAEAVKNQADPSEPGQQLTALKALQGDAIPEVADPVVAHLLDIQKALEEDWESGQRLPTPPEPSEPKGG